MSDIDLNLKADGSLNPQGAGPLYKSAPGDGRSVLPEGVDIFSGGMVFSPVMLLKRSAYEHNIAAMADFCRQQGVLHAPHGKTSMAPELLRGAVRHGAWGLSAATPAQVRAFRAFGIKNILLANELVDLAGIRWIGHYQRDNPDQAFICYVDSLAGVRILEQALADIDVTLNVLLEVSVPGGRTGCRSLSDALTIARALRDSAKLRLTGIAGYEGAIASDRGAESLEKVRRYCQWMTTVARAVDSEGLFAPGTLLLTAGGGTFFDIVTDMFKGVTLSQKTRVMIRSGAYMAHDDGLYARNAPFAQRGAAYQLRPALEIWGRVLSRPEPELAILDFGRRDVPFDDDLPLPHAFRDITGLHCRGAGSARITAVNDQHAYLRVAAGDPLHVGDWVGCGISHPCTAFDKWRYLPVVDDDYRCVGQATTYF
ncbi:alanine racemase [Martelella alba]|uniref:Amino acid deaminase n=1 Tax=Martelella alba TaxID=2590451 RepID=A0ABY2SLH4_9HYPH|nr:alanine racemase [Martelella alba]TKI06586.1 amino acid deaminase [Martelella alba]